MNRRDFFKNAAAMVGVTVLGKVAPATPSLFNGDATITISNELPATSVMPDSFMVPEWSIYDKGKWQLLYADELKTYEFIADVEQVI